MFDTALVPGYPGAAKPQLRPTTVASYGLQATSLHSIRFEPTMRLGRATTIPLGAFSPLSQRRGTLSSGLCSVGTRAGHSRVHPR
jgi:hypothetical protein